MNKKLEPSLKEDLDLASKKFKVLVDKIADLYNLKIGFEITWTWTENEKKSSEKE